jgi:hypothetical protein
MTLAPVSLPIAPVTELGANGLPLLFIDKTDLPKTARELAKRMAITGHLFARGGRKVVRIERAPQRGTGLAR